MVKVKTGNSSSVGVLNQRLVRHDEYFCKVLDLVHPSIYMPREEAPDNDKYWKNKKVKTPKHEKKMKNKLLKRAKFDPSNMKPIAELQKELNKKETEQKNERRKELIENMKKYCQYEEDMEQEKDFNSDDDDMDESDSECESDEGSTSNDSGSQEDTLPALKKEKKENKSTRKDKSAKENGKNKNETAQELFYSSFKTSETNAPKTPGELRERLHAKIEALRAARKANRNENSKNKKEGLDASNKSNESPKIKPTKGNTVKPVVSSDLGKGNQTVNNQKSKKSLGQVALQLSPSSTSNDETNKPIATTTPQDISLSMEFGKITVPEDNTEDLLINAGKSKGAKNYARMLEKAEEYQKKLSEMTPEKREEKEWKEAFATAHGDKPTNNIKALKNKIKNKEKSRERSTKRWKQIKQGEENTQKDKQEKREENLRKRKRSVDPVVLDSTGSNSSNLLQGVKSGVKTHILTDKDKTILSKSSKANSDHSKKRNENGVKKNRPGFEGRKQDFLNSNKKQKTK